MNILIIGAAGRLGRCLVDQALAAGFYVTALVRTARSASTVHERITAVQGDIHDTPSLNLLSAMKDSKDSRGLWVTSAGVDSEYVRHKSFLYKDIIKPLFLSNTYSDFKRSEEIIGNAPLRWTIVRPSRLTDGPLTETYRVQSVGIPPNAVKNSRADLAHFMLNEVISPQYEFMKPLVSY